MVIVYNGEKGKHKNWDCYIHLVLIRERSVIYTYIHMISDI